MMSLFPFLDNMDLSSCNIPFVVDDLSKPIGVIRVPNDTTVPPVLWYINDQMAELMMFPRNELIGVPVLTVYIPDDRTKFQLIPHMKDLPISHMSPFSPLGVRKNGSVIRLSARLQTFSQKKFLPHWTIVVVDGIEDVSPSFNPNTSIVPRLPKWLGQTPAFMQNAKLMNIRGSGPQDNRGINEKTSSAHGHPPYPYPAPGSGFSVNPLFCDQIPQPEALPMSEAKGDELNDLLTVLTPEYASWISDGTMG